MHYNFKNVAQGVLQYFFYRVVHRVLQYKKIVVPKALVATDFGTFQIGIRACMIHNSMNRELTNTHDFGKWKKNRFLNLMS